MKLSTCNYCNKIFALERNTKQFCSLECKNKFNYARRNGHDIPTEVYHRIKGEKANDALVDQLKERVAFLESELEKQVKPTSTETLEPVEIPELPTVQTKAVKVKKATRKDIPLLSKKERIVAQLLQEDIDLISKDDLSALGYPMGFFDGWHEEGEELENFEIRLKEDGYQLINKRDTLRGEDS